MLIREITQADLPEVFRWFETRKYPLPVRDRVGPEFGVIAEKDGTLLACLWAYLTGRSLAYLEFPAINPDSISTESYQAMDQVLDHFKRMCAVSSPKIEVLKYYTKNRKLAEYLRSKEFKLEEGYFGLTWVIKN